MSVTISSLVISKWKVNTYFIRSKKELLVLDPAEYNEDLTKILTEQNHELKGILCTHGHFDHISGVAEIQAEFNVSTYLHSNDSRLVNQINLYRKLAGVSNFVSIPTINVDLKNVCELSVGDEKLRVVHAPGHTMGSVIFSIDRNLFTGDLFYNFGIGRTDLPGGKRDVIINTIISIISEFEGYNIYPGHGEPFILNQDNINKIMRSADGG